MGAVVVVVTPPAAPAPLVRKFRCLCGRFLGEGTASRGWIVVKCPSCGAWRRLVFDRSAAPDVVD